MSYRKMCSILLQLLLLMLVVSHEATSLPAVDITIPAAAVNSIEESDKLPDTQLDLVNAATQETGLFNGNATSQESEGSGNGEAAQATDPTLTGDNVVSGSSNEPMSIYASGLITPEAFQQYLSQYGGGPLGAAYPAPIAATSGLYPFPGPIVVQTGYEGFLMPANAPVASDSTTDTSTTVAATSAPAAGMNPLMAFASRLLPSILMSTLFRIVAVVLSAIGVILFGSTITSALCRMTPICEIPSKAVDYLRSGGAQDVGRMIAEEITPERVRRTAEFVRNAVRKYRQLQKLVDDADSPTY